MLISLPIRTFTPVPMPLSPKFELVEHEESIDTLRWPESGHWIYEGQIGIHDPDPKFAIVSPKLSKLSAYPKGR